MTGIQHAIEKEDEVPAAIGAASLGPEKRHIGQILAFGGLGGLSLCMIVTLLSSTYRPFGAVGVFIFFFIWKIGKTILRGNLDKV